MRAFPEDIDGEKFDDLDMEDAVNHLPTKLRHIIKLYYLYGFAEDEIAEMYGLCRSMVSKEKRRALRKLRKHFGCPQQRPKVSCPKNSTLRRPRRSVPKPCAQRTNATCTVSPEMVEEFLHTFTVIARWLCPGDHHTQKDIVSEMFVALMTHTSDDWDRALRIRKAKLCAIDWLKSKANNYSWRGKFPHLSLDFLETMGWQVTTDGQWLRRGTEINFHEDLDKLTTCQTRRNAV